jgi:hypothetical protein
MGGRIVQLVQGEKLKLAFDDFDYWIERFAKYPLVQLIDLDAAMRQGENTALIESICKRLPCQVGGGLKHCRGRPAAARRRREARHLRLVLIQHRRSEQSLRRLAQKGAHRRRALLLRGHQERQGRGQRLEGLRRPHAGRGHHLARRLLRRRSSTPTSTPRAPCRASRWTSPPSCAPPPRSNSSSPAASRTRRGRRARRHGRGRRRRHGRVLGRDGGLGPTGRTTRLAASESAPRSIRRLGP